MDSSLYTRKSSFSNISLTFIATDSGGLSASKVVNITVNNVNQIPVARATFPQTTSLSAGANLSAVASTDGDNDPLTYVWSKVSGGTVTFNTPNLSITRATFSTTGIYVLRLTVSDGKGGTHSVNFNITVDNDPSGDRNGDGVENSVDICDGTRTDSTVNTRGCPVPNVENFTLEPNDLSQLDLRGVPSVSVSNQFGKITWNSPNNLYPLTKTTTSGEDVLDLDSNLSIHAGEVYLNSGETPGLSRLATITLYNINISNPEIIEDGESCEDCHIVSYVNRTLVFTVPHFSMFKVASNNPPTVSITSPGNSSTLKSPITISANATDAIGIESVSFYSNDTLISTDTTAPYSVSYSPGAGSYSIKAIAKDTGGLTTTSSPVSITVEATTPSGGGTSGTTVGTYSPSVGGGAITIYTNQSTNTSNCTATTLFDRMTGAACPKNGSSSITITSGTLSTLAINLKNNGVPAGFRFNKNLKLNANSLDVANLQRFLNLNGYTVATKGFGSIGLENKKFGPATRAALIKFQKANKIIPAVGYFGPTTRKVMNAKLNAIGL